VSQNRRNHSKRSKMGLFSKFIGKKKNEIITNQDFWTWFAEHEKTFHQVVKSRGNIERDFFNPLSEQLNALRPGYLFLAGMLTDDTAELVLTVDGVVKNIAFVENLVQDAPALKGWKFTALKPALAIDNVEIRMGDFSFGKDNLSFYANTNPNYPDIIDLKVVHADYDANIKGQIDTGVFIFMDNYLGELNTVTSIDALQVIPKEQAEEELIPIEKLKDYLIWREKEFIEKYEGTRYTTSEDTYSALEATLEDGKPLIAVVNTALLNWDRKASHPWILAIEINYHGNKSGMPDNKTYALLNEMEDELMLELKDEDGYLNIGRQTADHVKEIYFACKGFRHPSIVITQFQERYKGKLDIDYHLYKDKYWKSLEHFNPDR